MKTAKERLEALIEDIDGSIKALDGIGENEVMLTSAMISVSILTYSKATALAALVHVEHASAGAVTKNAFEQMKEMSEEHAKTFEEEFNEMRKRFEKNMRDNPFFQGGNGGNGV